MVSRRVCYTVLGWKFLSVAKIFLAERALYREASFFEMPHVYGGGNVQIDRRSERERVSSLFSGSSDKLCPFNQGGRGGRGRRQIRFGIRWEQETRTIIREISSVINLIFRFFFLFEQFLFEKYRARWIENSQFAIGRKLHCSSRRRKTLISRLKLKKSSLGCSPCWREAKIFAFLQMTRRKLGLNPTGKEGGFQMRNN